ncbi:MAG: hypothetical protein K2H20_03485, partial [Bacilli bacterium]|nr:hypothetical protein [Bacilli bacterium]
DVYNRQTIYHKAGCPSECKYLKKSEYIVVSLASSQACASSAHCSCLLPIKKAKITKVIKIKNL